jgi:hypothetical protein
MLSPALQAKTALLVQRGAGSKFIIVKSVGQRLRFPGFFKFPKGFLIQDGFVKTFKTSVGPDVGVYSDFVRFGPG